VPSADRVLLDATAVPPDRGGVGRYVDALVPALIRCGVDLEVACMPADEALFDSLGARTLVARRARGRGGRMLWEQTALPALVRARRPGVLHSPHYTQPLVPPPRRGAHPAATAVTLHDATFFTDPRLHGRVKGPFFRTATRLAVHRADVGIVPSRATADELVRAAGARADRLHVAHHGVDEALFRPPAPADAEAARRAVGLAPAQPYVAFLGTLEPRKNLPALVRGFVAACADRVDPPALVLAGGSGWDDQLDAAIARAPARLRILRPGYLPLAVLAGFLGGALLVAYPSLGEGFGLPVLEAMACGAPILTTRRLALPEVGGDAVDYCDVDDASIARGLGRLLDDPGRRAQLGSAALRRAATFTWDACAQAHRDAYAEAVEHAHAGRRPR
jgi:glycosyltransferase involved in cell wall biosynthesis